MKNLCGTSTARSVRPIMFSLLIATLLVSVSFWGSAEVEANHPVYVEGNCDSPIPGQTTVAAGVCGDWDGDGLIGTAEDTDGADRIFGTLNAALGPGTGAAVNTGIRHNGRIIIVASGRFPETLHIGNQAASGGPGITSPGNVTIEAAPGVEANIDAVLSGAPAAANNARQSASGITIFHNSVNRIVTLRNLVIRNFSTGINIFENSRVNIDNCRIENSGAQNVRVTGAARVVITNSQIQAAGFRISSVAPNGPGHGVLVLGDSQMRISHTTIANNLNGGIVNQTGAASNVVLFKVGTFFNNPNISGPFTVAPNTNHSF